MSADTSNGAATFRHTASSEDTACDDNLSIASVRATERGNDRPPPPPPENRAPTADAGDDQTVDEGDTVTLDGGGSRAPDGDTLSYRWTAPVLRWAAP